MRIKIISAIVALTVLAVAQTTPVVTAPVNPSFMGPGTNNTAYVVLEPH
jgi:hypothetical protein